MKFAIADEDEHSHLMSEFGLDESGEEVNIGCYGPDGKKYPMEPMEEWEDEDVEEFVSKMKKGRKYRGGSRDIIQSKMSIEMRISVILR